MSLLAQQIGRLQTLDGHPARLPGGDGLAPSWHLWKRTEINAITAALAAERPLLVRGEPGTGKSQLARAAAAALGWHLHTCTLHARSEAHDLLYQFDAVRRLADAQAKKWNENDENRYWQPQALWQALDWDGAHDFGSLRDACKAAGGTKPAAPPGHVVLIDEIDKAPGDVPNGLLEVLGARRFEIAALGRSVCASRAGDPRQSEADRQWPLVIITTNEERELPPAFQRRCMVLNHGSHDKAGYPGFLIEHGLAHFGPGRDGGDAIIDRALLADAARQLTDDRGHAQQAQMPAPGLAEYLDLLYALHRLAPGDTDQQRYWLDQLNQYAYLKNRPNEGEAGAAGMLQAADGMRAIAASGS